MLPRRKVAGQQRARPAAGLPAGHHAAAAFRERAQGSRLVPGQLPRVHEGDGAAAGE
ncbi:MAG: hypothetical protein ABI611_20975 [Solirubrobacteraceae bacterium]